MNKSKAFMQLGVAFILAVCAGTLIYYWMSSRSVAQVVKVVEPETVPVAVATADLTIGTKLGEGMVKVVDYLKESVPEHHYPDLATVEGRVLIAHIGKNEPITESRLASMDVTAGGMSALISKGKRAVAVKGTKVLGLAGHIRPGHHVDVLVTMQPQSYQTDQKQEPFTKVVLQNVLVLGTGTELEASADGQELSPVDTFTLEMSPEECEKLGLAATLGTLHFALRNGEDEDMVLTSGATIEGSLSSFRPYIPGVRAASGTAKAPRRVISVQMITGNEMSTVTF